MFNKKVILLIFLIFLSLSAVSANSTDDSVSTSLVDNGNLTVESDDNIVHSESGEGNFKELTGLIENVSQNGTLELTKDYKHDSGDCDGIEISKSITISGNGHIINGSDASGIFKISNSNIILKDIIFSNAFSGDCGGAINLNNVNCEIINCSFINNQANNAGGAIYSSNSNINIANCTFTNNMGYGLFVQGGAIYATYNSTVNAVNTKFYRNNADCGGAIFTFNFTDLNINYCDFFENIANYYGGSIYSDSVINVNYSNFYSNKAKLKGGAIHSSNSPYFCNDCLMVDNSNFYNNSAEWGGAILCSNIGNNLIYNSTFVSNHAVCGAAYSRTSINNVSIIDSSCFDNEAINGTIIYAPSCGEITLRNNNFTNNGGDYGVLIYTVQGRFNLTFLNHNITINNCNISDNKALHSLIFSLWGNILLNNSNLVYHDNSYPCFVIYKIANGTVNYENNFFGVEEPDFTKLIYVNDTIGSYNLSDSSTSSDMSDGACSSNIIQIDENHTVVSYRRDSSVPLTLFIGGNGEMRQVKLDDTYFIHLLITNDGWVFTHGGFDGPYVSEQVEAIAKKMIENNNISQEYLDLIYDLKYFYGLSMGHFIIKAPDGRYAIADYFNQSSHGFEMGILKPGEYILCPNNFLLHKKGNISDFEYGDNILTSRYIAATDLYGVYRTTIQTYDFKKEIIDGQLISHVEVYISNDDGHFRNVSWGDYFNDVYYSDMKYLFGENIPIIMDGKYLEDYILDTVQLNKTKLNASPIVTAYGDSDYLTVTLLDEFDNPLEGKQISIGLNNSNLTLITNQEGQVKVPTANLNSGTYIVLITFKGDEVYADSEELSVIVVNKLETELTSSSISAVYNINKNLVVTLKDERGNAIEGVKVNIVLNGMNHVLSADKNGQAKLSTKGLAPNIYYAVILFNGNENYKNSYKTAKITVKKAKVKLTAKNKLFKKSKKIKKYKVTLKNNIGKAVKNVKINLKIEGKIYNAKTNKKGVATFKIKKFNKKGSFKSKVKFAGNKYYKPLTKTVKIKIK